MKLDFHKAWVGNFIERHVFVRHVFVRHVFVRHVILHHVFDLKNLFVLINWNKMKRKKLK